MTVMASYGKCITDFLKHETVKIVGPKNYNKNVRRVKDNIGHQDLVDGFEIKTERQEVAAYFFFFPINNQ